MSGYRMLYSIAKFIESLSGCIFELGKTLFIGYVPTREKDGIEAPDRCGAVLANAPGLPVPDLPDWEEKAIQFWNRAASYDIAQDDAYCVYASLHGTAGWTLPSALGGPPYCAMVINAVGTPAVIENPGERGLFVFSTNYVWSMAEEFPP